MLHGCFDIGIQEFKDGIGFHETSQSSPDYHFVQGCLDWDPSGQEMKMALVFIMTFQRSCYKLRGQRNFLSGNLDDKQTCIDKFKM